MENLLKLWAGRGRERERMKKNERRKIDQKYDFRKQGQGQTSIISMSQRRRNPTRS
jgi:hypothetical protein